MKNYKLLLGAILFISALVLNVSVHSSNSPEDISILELNSVHAEPEEGDSQYNYDISCVECAQPGTVIFACVQGHSNCFSISGCAGGMC